MKPKSKLQHRVLALSEAMLSLSETVKAWAFESCILHLGYRLKKGTQCLSCGHVWQGHPSAKNDVCPACDRKLKIEDTKKKNRNQWIWFAVIETCEEFQVNKFFELRTYHKAGNAPRISIRRTVEQWLQLGGKDEVIARNRGGMGQYQSYNFYGSMEIRDRRGLFWQFNLNPNFIYPKVTCLPIYKRNGFKGNFCKVDPFTLFNKLPTDNKLETLLKSKQPALTAARASRDREGEVERYWDSVKICIRNNYIVKDAGMWLDYLQLLSYFGRDLRSAKYVCPTDLKGEHDRLVAKKRDVERKRKLEQMRKEASQDQEAYVNDKGMFFGLVFTKGPLSIKVLESVQEFMEEADAHRHCVFSNRYYRKQDSLIFSAQMNGVRVETVELSLSELKVLQSRGLGNSSTPHHDMILEIMQKNLRHIKKIRDASMKENIAA